MKKVITYGTYDVLHHGHIRLLERAKALGDYLIVGVTSDDFDKTRGKINVQQSLMERIEAVRAIGIADEVIVEEYEGQKIDDIRKYEVDIFTVGSDWVGKFDYLNEFCEVVYLPRTEGVSSSEIRDTSRKCSLGIIYEKHVYSKIIEECKYVNGMELKGFCVDHISDDIRKEYSDFYLTEKEEDLLEKVEAVYIGVNPERRAEYTERAIKAGKHVLCEAPIAIDDKVCADLFELAEEKGVVLMTGIKTAYSTAYNRILLMARDGRIGDIVSIDTVCTSLSDPYYGDEEKQQNNWNSIYSWGPIALLPIFQILGHEYKNKSIVSRFMDEGKKYDAFTKIDFVYDRAVASVLVGKGIKSEGSLTICGTKGYIYVPAPWWKTDYFEARYENSDSTRKYFYQLDGEGIRYELVAFVRAISSGNDSFYINRGTSVAISKIMKDFTERKDFTEIGV